MARNPTKILNPSSGFLCWSYGETHKFGRKRLIPGGGLYVARLPRKGSMENAEKPKLKIGRILKGVLFGMIGIIVISVVIGMSSGDSDTDNSNQNQDSGYTYVTAENTFERQVEQKVIDALGKTNNTKKPRVIGITAEKYNAVELAEYKYPAGANVTDVLVKINASENLTTNLQKGTMDDEAFDIFKNTFPLSPEIGDVIIWSYMPTKDQYGNQKDDIAIIYSMGRPLFEKINWTTLNHRELPDLLRKEGAVDTRNGYAEKIKF